MPHDDFWESYTKEERYKAVLQTTRLWLLGRLQKTTAEQMLNLIDEPLDIVDGPKVRLQVRGYDVEE